jgi:TRAP-type C4-dicarboxylate transport system permease small subunit
MMPQFGKLVVVAGLMLVALGLLVWAGDKIPGNLTWRGKNTTVFFPLGACLLVSVVGSLLLLLMQRR